MRLTQKLLGFLNRVFDKDPAQTLAFRISHVSNALTWAVADNALTLTISGNVDAVIDLSALTLGELVTTVASLAGYSASGLSPGNAGLSSAVLLDATGDTSVKGGDALYAYTTLLWSYMDAVASELGVAADQIDVLADQMQVTTASGSWLDEIGGYYNSPRLAGELDAAYGPRIIAEAIRPKSNNIALEIAIESAIGTDASVQNVVTYGGLFPLFDGTVKFDGSHDYSASPEVLYGLFDIFFTYDIVGGGDLAGSAATIRSLVEKNRAAGTHLRQLGVYLNTPEGVLTTEYGDPLVWPI